ncbi:hypothetical protein GWI33_014980 [Rhynchophorus ferrugineus]|uniref:Uncharacterized protein n=1 Tax=Rhynchophorus ferrugineus TaxID=354439 RepID=A0A834I3G3_RHYFE|nr:hypothetical protein GWI33_014980 [Rhynchophorus ferrugineus]
MLLLSRLRQYGTDFPNNIRQRSVPFEKSQRVMACPFQFIKDEKNGGKRHLKRGLTTRQGSIQVALEDEEDRNTLNLKSLNSAILILTSPSNIHTFYETCNNDFNISMKVVNAVTGIGTPVNCNDNNFKLFILPVITEFKFSSLDVV